MVKALASSAPDHELTFTDWVGFIAMVVGIFMAILDIQIVSSSLQQIQAGLSATRRSSRNQTMLGAAVTPWLVMRARSAARLPAACC